MSPLDAGVLAFAQTTGLELRWGINGSGGVQVWGPGPVPDLFHAVTFRALTADAFAAVRVLQYTPVVPDPSVGPGPATVAISVNDTGSAPRDSEPLQTTAYVRLVPARDVWIATPDRPVVLAAPADFPVARAVTLRDPEERPQPMRLVVAANHTLTFADASAVPVARPQDYGADPTADAFEVSLTLALRVADSTLR